MDLDPPLVMGRVRKASIPLWRPLSLPDPHLHHAVHPQLQACSSRISSTVGVLALQTEPAHTIPEMGDMSVRINPSSGGLIKEKKLTTMNTTKKQ